MGDHDRVGLDFIDTCQKQIAIWDGLDHAALVFPADPIELQRVEYCWSWCAHTYQMSKVAMSIVTSGLTVEAMPVIRSAFEAAVSAVWIWHTADSAAAIQRECVRLSRTFVDDVKKLENPAYEQPLADLPDLESFPTPPADSSARHFWEMCTQIDGGRRRYAQYRTMSMYCHPGLVLSGQYVIKDVATSEMVLQPQPVALPVSTALVPLADAMIMTAEVMAKLTWARLPDRSPFDAM